MRDDFREQLYRNFNQKETNELIEIWQTNNHIEWSDMAFDVIREILQERLAELPPQSKPIIESKNARPAVTMMFCQSCGREAQTKYVEYHQNIGVLVMRFSKHVKGYFCKDCSRKYFWSFTGTTFFLGWWGIISFVATLFILPNNIIQYLGTLKLAVPDPTKPPPMLTDAVVERIRPYAAELFQRVNEGEEMETVAKSIAERTNASPGQVLIFAFAVAQALREKKN